MTANRRHSRRAAVATAVAAAVLTAGLVSGCDSSDSSDNAANSAACFPGMGTIAASLIAIHQAGLDAANDPARTDQSISVIGDNLAKMGDKTDNAQFNEAVDDLSRSIADYNKAVLNGDPHPDPSAITHAADELADVCAL